MFKLMINTEFENEFKSINKKTSLVSPKTYIQHHLYKILSLPKKNVKLIVVILESYV